MIPSIFHDPASHRPARERQRVRYFPSRGPWMYGTDSILPHATPRWTDRRKSLIVGPFGSSNVYTGESLAPHRGDEGRSTYIHTHRKSEGRVPADYLPALCQMKYSRRSRPLGLAPTPNAGFWPVPAHSLLPTLIESSSSKATASHDSKVGLVGTSWGKSWTRECLWSLTALQLISAGKSLSWRPCRDGELRCAIFPALVVARLSRAGRDSSLARSADLDIERVEGGGGWMTLLSLSLSHSFSLRLFSSLFCSQARMGLLYKVAPLYGTHRRFGSGGDGRTSRADTIVHNATLATHSKASMDVPSSLLTGRRYSTLPTGNIITCIRSKGLGRGDTGM